MKGAYLEVTYRNGRPLAAYYRLPPRTAEVSYRTERAGPGLVVDFDREGRAIGIEITTPKRLRLASLNKVLRSLGFDAVTEDELKPLHAA